ncbi:MAG: hypothetical protein H6627_00710 [Calditrichae bacterium]|nr:hypothetical protein [Calditrichota bacterium]MCB9057057.1 hypothetical protein [Calditrichia bacterium]
MRILNIVKPKWILIFIIFLAINLYATYNVFVDIKPYDLLILMNSSHQIDRFEITEGDTTYIYHPVKFEKHTINKREKIIDVQYIRSDQGDELPSFHLSIKGYKGTFNFKGKEIEAHTGWEMG